MVLEKTTSIGNQTIHFVQSIASLADDLPPAARFALGILGVVGLCGMGYAVKSLCGRCCTQAPSVRMPLDRPTLDRAVAALQRGDPSVRRQAKRTLTASVAQGTWIPELIAAATQGTLSANQDERDASISLWQILFQHQQGFPAAITTATQGIGHQNRGVQVISALLWNQLFKHNQGIAAALSAAIRGTCSQDLLERSISSVLWEDLFKHDQGVPIAISLAAQKITSEDGAILGEAVTICEVLFKVGKGFEELVPLLVQGMSSPNHLKQNASLRLFQAIVPKGRSYDKAWEAASIAIKSDFPILRENAVTILRALFQRGVKQALIKELWLQTDAPAELVALREELERKEHKEHKDRLIVRLRKGAPAVRYHA